MVTAQSYRNPALLATMAACVDAMSGGRLEFGLGAGWKELEYRAYGYEFPPDGVRVTQMIEALEICRRMWTEDRATYHGTHYRIDDALCAPKPQQDPLPIWIGGSKPRVMRAAARRAHWFNLTISTTRHGAQRVAESMRQLDGICAEVKRDPKTLKRSVFLGATVATRRERVDELIEGLAAQEKTDRAAWLAARPGQIFGTPQDALVKLREFAKLGIAHANLRFDPYGTEREQIAALAEITAQLS
jgi:alkanesulfonate monooxygenase SsuD/methylene tetrahydromethanopterin reductase-like flavin-dependent oxidoreductase (luciferase family)